MRKGVITGSFDPITNGHIDIIRRASKLVDELVVLIAYNPNKKTMFTIEERKLMVSTAIKEIENTKVEVSEKLVVDFCEQIHANVLIRGLRNTSDYEYEATMIKYNHDLNDQVETICLVSKPELKHISSSGVKELIKFNRGFEKLVPENVSRLIKEKNENI